MKEEIAEQKAGMDAALNAGIDAFKEQFAKASEQEIVAKNSARSKKIRESLEKYRAEQLATLVDDHAKGTAGLEEAHEKALRQKDEKLAELETELSENIKAATDAKSFTAQFNQGQLQAQAELQEAKRYSCSS